MFQIIITQFQTVITYFRRVITLLQTSITLLQIIITLLQIIITLLQTVITYFRKAFALFRRVITLFRPVNKANDSASPLQKISIRRIRHPRHRDVSCAWPHERLNTAPVIAVTPGRDAESYGFRGGALYIHNIYAFRKADSPPRCDVRKEASTASQATNRRIATGQSAPNRKPL